MRAQRLAAGWAGAALAALAVAPLLAPFLWTGFRAALQPHPTLGLVTNLEQPLSVRSPTGAWAVLATAAWFGLAYHNRRVGVWEAALAAIGGSLALVRLGNAWLLALGLGPPLARQLALLELGGRARWALGAALLAVSLLALVTSRPALLPTPVVEAARAAPGEGSVFAPLPWATPLSTALGGRRAVLGAGDPWAVAPSYWEDYARISLADERWAALLGRYGAELLVLDAVDAQRLTARAVRASSDWQVLLDADGALVARRAQP